MVFLITHELFHAFRLQESCFIRKEAFDIMDLLFPRELIDFISASPSTFHASQNLSSMLEKSGFLPLYEGEIWNLQPGKCYFLRRNLTSLIAFRIPKKPVKSFQMASAHLDSPTFHIKGNMEIHSTHYTRLNVENYGGMLLPSWFDRPLSVAGKVIVEENGELISRLVNVDRDLLMIPRLAIHMSPQANSGENLSVQTDMLPLFGDEAAKNTFMDTIASSINKNSIDILGFDLYLYLRTRGTIWGAKGEFLSAPRLDDLECAYILVKSLIAAEGHEEAISLCALFDHEEVGSSTKDGAGSVFLQTTLERIRDSLAMEYQTFQAALASSFMVSADNAHAKHPNHPEKADPTTYPIMNRGVVIKFHGGKKYATDSASSAIFRSICRRANVPTQMFSNHSDMRSGSTLGNISALHVPVNTVDIGLAQLSMHSCYETAGTQDPVYLMQAMTKYFNSRVQLTQPGCYRILSNQNHETVQAEKMYHSD